MSEPGRCFHRTFCSTKLTWGLSACGFCWYELWAFIWFIWRIGGPPSRGAWGIQPRWVKPAWEGITAFPDDGKWRRFLRPLDLSDPGGVLMSTVNGNSAIGSTTGVAMATSEDADPAPSVHADPAPSVHVPEGADIPTKERKGDGWQPVLQEKQPKHTSKFQQLCFLEPCTQR